MDGASSFRIFIEIIMPLSRPILAVVAPVLVHWAAGGFHPSPAHILRTPDKYTLPIGLWQPGGAKNGCQLHHLRGGGVLIAVHWWRSLYLALQKYFVSGLTSGSTKG